MKEERAKPEYLEGLKGSSRGRKNQSKILKDLRFQNTIKTKIGNWALKEPQGRGKGLGHGLGGAPAETPPKHERLGLTPQQMRNGRGKTGVSADTAEKIANNEKGGAL